MHLTVLTIYLLSALALATDKVNQPIPDDLKDIMAFEPEPDRPLSFYTGFNEDGTPVEDLASEDDFPEGFFPQVPSALDMNALRKPLNEAEIRQRWADRSSEEDDWSSEYNPTREASFYTGEGVTDTPDVPLNPTTPELLALEKKEANTLEAKNVIDKK